MAKQAPRVVRRARTVSVTLSKAGRCSVDVDGRRILVVRKVTETVQAYIHPAKQ